MPVVELISGIAGQLQLAHFFGELESVSRIVQSGDVPDACEYPFGLERSRNPEQIAVADETSVALGHPAIQCTRSLMQCNDALAFVRAEPSCEGLAVVKSFPHVDRTSQALPQSGLDPLSLILRNRCWETLSVMR